MSECGCLARWALVCCPSGWARNLGSCLLRVRDEANGEPALFSLLTLLLRLGAGSLGAVLDPELHCLDGLLVEDDTVEGQSVSIVRKKKSVQLTNTRTHTQTAEQATALAGHVVPG